ncbi:hypothetical protein K525DRAFT_270489 [Schizophyllum commune Loenen D]|nr:hypothetical protein K525DRAFT_270489 [Schizophyllum commune Loenen D]
MNTAIVKAKGMPVPNRAVTTERGQAQKPSRRTTATPPLAEPGELQAKTTSAVSDALSAPIDVLPTELLAEIFMRLRDSIVAEHDFCPSPTPILDTTITRVCKAWRVIAHTTPMLWIYIPPGAEDFDLQQYLPRTGGCLLNLQSSTRSSEMVAFLAKVRPLVARCRELRLYDQGQAFSEIEPLATPKLEFVYIYMYQYDLPDRDRLLAFLKNAPRLRRLHIISQNHRNPDFGLTLPPSSRITSLRLDVIFLSGASMTTVLEQCSETLRELELQAERAVPWPAPPQAPVNLHALMRIRFYAYTCGVLQYINPPSLEHVSFLWKPEDSLRDFNDFLVRFPIATTQIRSLEVNPCLDTMDAYLQCLKKMTNLQKLRFCYIAKSEAAKILNALICRDNVPPLAPKLTSIDLHSDMKSKWVYKKFMSSRVVPRVVCGTQVSAMRDN